MEFSNQKNRQKTPGNAFSDALLLPRFQNFATGATKQKFVETALRTVLIALHAE